VQGDGKLALAVRAAPSCGLFCGRVLKISSRGWLAVIYVVDGVSAQNRRETTQVRQNVTSLSAVGMNAHAQVRKVLQTFGGLRARAGASSMLGEVECSACGPLCGGHPYPTS
jgi:hypothetical protein